jgi:hypothetical protein
MGLKGGNIDDLYELSKEESDEKDISDLPPEVISHILRDVNDKDILSFALVTLDIYIKSQAALKDRYKQRFIMPKIPDFFTYITTGQQDKAEELLKTSKYPQAFLYAKHKFQDSSGRIFHCTAYEYAYWAKDSHMRRMLEKYMDNSTKARMLEFITEIRENGLSYQFEGKMVDGESHCDYNSLILALENYVNIYDDALFDGDQEAIDDAWSNVAEAQAKLPMNVIQEYCSPSRSFEEVPDFTANDFQRTVTFKNSENNDEAYAAKVSIGLYRGDLEQAEGEGPSLTRHANISVDIVEKDLLAMRKLNEVRTNELDESFNKLNQSLEEIEAEEQQNLGPQP